MLEKHVGNVEIIEHGIDPLKPSGLRRQTFLLIAAGAGLLAALAWISVLEFFDHRVYEAEDLQARLGAPVVAVIPVMKGRRRTIWSKEQTVMTTKARRT